MSSSTETSFTGFPEDTSLFFRDLSANNNRAWFERNRSRYETNVYRPAQEFVRTVGPRLAAIEPRIEFESGRGGGGSIFRIFRDTRFSSNKDPYKTNLGMLFWFGDGRPKRQCPHLYVGVYADKVIVHGGLKSPPAPLLKRYRSALQKEASGRALRQRLESLAADGFDVAGPTFKRPPQGFSVDHPNLDLALLDGVFAEKALGPRVARSASLVNETIEVFQALRPLLEWLSTGIGPR